MTTIMSTKDNPARPTRVARMQDGVLLVIVLLVGIMAGAASFNHVHDFTIHNSPTGTADWFGWANAVISELIPTAALIEIGRRRRKNPAAKVGYPMVLLVAAISVSLTAQLAVAKPVVFGWMVSALPALAFFALSKLVFTATAPPRPTNPVTAPTPATSPAPSSDTPRAKVTPAADTSDQGHHTRPESRTGNEDARTESDEEAPASASAKPVPAAPAPAATTMPVATDQPFPELLLANARTIAASHRDEHGEDINPNQMAVRLRVPTPIATDILSTLATNPPTAANTRPHNGTAIAGVTA